VLLSTREGDVESCSKDLGKALEASFLY